jgi:hypothetical protein
MFTNDENGFNLEKINAMWTLRRLLIKEISLIEAKKIVEYFFYSLNIEKISTIGEFKSFSNLISGFNRGCYTFENDKILISREANSLDFEIWKN